MTRPYNTTPLLEDDGPDLIECPECREQQIRLRRLARHIEDAERRLQRNPANMAARLDLYRGEAHRSKELAAICPRCDGTGTIDRHDDDGSDAFDAACDDAHERQIDREAGL